MPRACQNAAKRVSTRCQSKRKELQMYIGGGALLLILLIVLIILLL